MKKITLTRENAYKLIELVRDIVNTIDLSVYLEDDLQKDKIELEEDLLPCPCCGYKTLTERFDLKKGTGYDICPYCGWEDDGTTDIGSYRSINKGRILDYRNKISENANKYYLNKWLKE